MGGEKNPKQQTGKDESMKKLQEE